MASDKQKQVAMRMALTALCKCHFQIINLGREMNRRHPRIAQRPEMRWTNTLAEIGESISALRFALGEEGSNETESQN